MIYISYKSKIISTEFIGKCIPCYGNTRLMCYQEIWHYKRSATFNPEIVELGDGKISNFKS